MEPGAGQSGAEADALPPRQLSQELPKMVSIHADAQSAGATQHQGSSAVNACGRKLPDGLSHARDADGATTALPGGAKFRAVSLHRTPGGFGATRQ